MMMDEMISAYGQDIRKIKGERDRLRAALSAHHDLAHVTEDDMRRYWQEGDHKCPVCSDARREETERETT